MQTRGEGAENPESLADVLYVRSLKKHPNAVRLRNSLCTGYAVTFLKAASHWREGFLLGSGGGSSSRSYFPSRSYSSAAVGSRTRRVKDETENRNSLLEMFSKAIILNCYH